MRARVVPPEAEHVFLPQLGERRVGHLSSSCQIMALNPGALSSYLDIPLPVQGTFCNFFIQLGGWEADSPTPLYPPAPTDIPSASLMVSLPELFGV